MVGIGKPEQRSCQSLYHHIGRILGLRHPKSILDEGKAEKYLEEIKDEKHGGYLDSWGIEAFSMDEEDDELILRKVFVYTLFSEKSKREPFCRSAVEEGLRSDRTPKQCVNIGAYNSEEHRYFTGYSFVSEEHAKKLAEEAHQKWLRFTLLRVFSLDEMSDAERREEIGHIVEQIERAHD